MDISEEETLLIIDWCESVIETYGELTVDENDLYLRLYNSVKGDK